MKRHTVILTLLVTLICCPSLAQSVGIGSNEFTADESAILELRSDSKGILVPRLTRDQRNRITSPSTGLLIYQTDSNSGFFYFDGNLWASVLTLQNLPVDDNQIIAFDPVSFKLSLENGGIVDLSILRNGRSLLSTLDNGDGTITFIYNDGTSFTTSDLRGEKGDTGPAGKDANTILTGTTDPSGGLGKEGDIYINTISDYIFGPKTSTGWGLGNSLTGAPGVDGQTILSATTDPIAGLGNNGDYYINTLTNVLFGPKTSGNWNTGQPLIGPAGKDGIDGTNGLDGKDGADGINGTSILSSTSDPLAINGNDGDFYINTTSSTLFGPKTAGTWGTGNSLIGATGKDGLNGVNGIDGKDGAGGTNGIDGLDGVNGLDGRTILSNNSNPSAADGNDGDFYINTVTSTLFGPKSGGTWALGNSLIGVAGKDGVDGVNGVDGKDGTNGINGVDGKDGIDGADGTNGVNGTNGADGADGADGTNGIDGIDGANGQDGRTILNGTINPSVGIGIDGDFYLNTNTERLFGPKSGGTWNAGVSLVGVGIQSSSDNPDGSITFNFTDGTSFTSQPDGDFSDTNELISNLNLSGKVLQITENGITKSINLSALSGSTEILDGDADTKVTVDESGLNDNTIRFRTGGTETMRLNNKTLEFLNNSGTIAIGENSALNNSGAGNLAIGTEASFQNTTGRFNVALGYRALRQNTAGQGNIAIGYNAGFNETGSDKLYLDNSNTNSPLLWGDFANDLLNVNGKLGIGIVNPTNMTNELEVNGSAIVISLTQTSDKRLKQNIRPLTQNLNKLEQINGVSFDWRTSEFPERRFRSGRQIGFLAQELQAVYPELVSQSADGFYSVSYSGMAPILVEAIKEQQTIITELQELIKELRKDMKSTQNQLSEIQKKLK